jgi:hypothetical protein
VGSWLDRRTNRAGLERRRLANDLCPRREGVIRFKDVREEELDKAVDSLLAEMEPGK